MPRRQQDKTKRRVAPDVPLAEIDELATMRLMTAYMAVELEPLSNSSAEAARLLIEAISQELQRRRTELKIGSDVLH